MEDATKKAILLGKRISFLDKYFAFLTNHLNSLYSYNDFLSIGFAGILLRSLMLYLTSEKFLNDNQIPMEIKSFLENKRDKVLILIDGVTSLGAGMLQATDQKLFQDYPSILLIESLTGKECGDILFNVYRSKIGLNNKELSERHAYVDRWIVHQMELLEEVHPGTRYSKQVFAALVMRSVMYQILAANNENLDEGMKAYLERKKLELAVVALSWQGIYKSSFPMEEYATLQKHSPIYICTSLHSPSHGSKLIKLLTMSDAEIDAACYDEL